MLLALLILFSAVGILMLALSLYLISKLFAEAKLGAVFRTGVEGEGITFALTDAYLPRIKCLRKFWFAPSSTAEAVYAEQILICRGGVFVITSFNERGKIENPFDDDWTLTNGKQVRRVQNPFYKNYDALSCIEGLADQAGMIRPVIYSIAVVTDPQAEFTKDYDLLVPADEYPACMRRLTRNRFYSKRFVRKFSRYIEEKRVAAPAKSNTKHT